MTASSNTTNDAEHMTDIMMFCTCKTNLTKEVQQLCHSGTGSDVETQSDVVTLVMLAAGLS